jgi:hypothetical protein
MHAPFLQWMGRTSTCEGIVGRCRPTTLVRGSNPNHPPPPPLTQNHIIRLYLKSDVARYWVVIKAQIAIEKSGSSPGALRPNGILYKV